MATSMRRLLLRHGIAVLGVGLTWIVLRFLALGAWPGSWAVGSCLAIVVGARFGGLGPGLLATALLTALGATAGSDSQPGLIAAGGVLLCALVESLHAARRRAEADARAQREGQGLLRRLLEATDEGILTVDSLGRATYANPRLGELLGCRPEDLVGRDSGEILGAEVRLAVGPDAGRGPRKFGLRRLRRRDGSEFWGTIATARLVDARGHHDGALAVISDETEFERAGAALRASDRFTRAVLDSLAAHVAVLDESGEILAVNRAWRDFAEANGAVGEDVAEGANYLAVCDAAGGANAEAAAFAAGLRAVLAGRSASFALEYPCDGPGPGQHRWFLGRVTPFAGEGTPRAVVAHEEITERRRAEDQLRESRERFRVAFEAAAIGMGIVAPDGRWLQANRALCEILGRTEEELRATTWQAITHPKDIGPCLRLVGRLAAGEIDSFQAEKRFVHHLGRTVWARVSVSAERDGQGRPSCLVGLIEDITPRKRAERSLRRSQAILRGFYDSVPMAMGVAEAWGEADVRLVSVNRAGAQFLGLPRDRVAGELAGALGLPRDILALCRRRHRESRQAGRPVRFEVAPGLPLAPRWVAITICSLDASPGRRSRFSFVIEDIAERKQGEDARAQLAAIVASTDDAVIGKSLDGVITSWNAGAERLYGYAAAEVVGRTFCLLLPPQRKDEEMRILERVGRGERISHYETVRLRKDGRPVDVSLSVSPIRDASGAVLGAASIARNISERKRIEAAMLRQARHTALRADVSAAFNRGEVPLEDTLRACVAALIRHLDAALARVWTLDPDEDVLRLRASAGLYTHTDGPHGSIPVGTLKIGQIARRRQPHLTNDVQADPRVDTAWARREGLVAFAGYPLLVEDRLVGVLAVFADHPLAQDDVDALAFVAAAIAQGIRRKLLEQERVDLLARAQHARAEAEAASRAKDRFLAVLSHELRTPLTPVLMAASALLDEDAAPEIRPTLEMICHNIELEARLIDDLLDVSLLARGGLRLEPETVEVHEAIGRAVEICQPEVVAAELTIGLDLRARQSHVRADRARMLQILWNLIRNAAKFTPDGGALTIRTDNAPGSGDAGDRLVIEFHDTGIGIEPEALARIFDPFEQGLPGRRRRFGGLGLGLSISRSLAEAHGGLLTASSPGIDQGATFRLALPTVPAPAAECPAAPAEPVGAARPPRGLRLLLVEDNKDTLRYLALVLRKRGHEVRTAENLDAAHAAAASAPFDLLLSDIELPDGTGLDLMRALGGGRGVPGIAMSGFGSEDDVRQSLAAGFATHLTKPIDVGQLDEAIARFAPAPAAAAPRGEGRADEPLPGRAAPPIR